jgi:hypothetical protein
MRAVSRPAEKQHPICVAYFDGRERGAASVPRVANPQSPNACERAQSRCRRHLALLRDHALTSSQSFLASAIDTDDLPRVASAISKMLRLRSLSRTKKRPVCRSKPTSTTPTPASAAKADRPFSITWSHMPSTTSATAFAIGPIWHRWNTLGDGIGSAEPRGGWRRSRRGTAGMGFRAEPPLDP